MLAQLIRDRRSVYVYEDRPVPPELIAELLKTASWAPNHHLTEPWRFVLVHGEGRQRLADIQAAMAQMYEPDPIKREEKGRNARATILAVPAYLVVLTAEAPHPLEREEGLAATHCLVQNFLLLAWERGLGVGWLTTGMMFDARFRAFLRIAPGEKVAAFLRLGYPARVPAPQARAPIAERLQVVDRIDPEGLSVPGRGDVK